MSAIQRLFSFSVVRQIKKFNYNDFRAIVKAAKITLLPNSIT